MSVIVQQPMSQEPHRQESLGKKTLEEEEKRLLNPLILLCQIFREINAVLREHRFDEKKIAQMADEAYLKDTTNKAAIYPEIVKVKEFCGYAMVAAAGISVAGNASAFPLGNFLSNRISAVLTPDVVKMAAKATGTYGNSISQQYSELAKLKKESDLTFKEYEIGNDRQHLEASKKNETTMEQEIRRFQELFSLLLRITAKDYGVSN